MLNDKPTLYNIQEMANREAIHQMNIFLINFFPNTENENESNIVVKIELIVYVMELMKAYQQSSNKIDMIEHVVQKK